MKCTYFGAFLAKQHNEFVNPNASMSVQNSVYAMGNMEMHNPQQDVVPGHQGPQVATAYAMGNTEMHNPQQEVVPAHQGPQVATEFCHNCGEQQEHVDHKFCQSCGEPLKNNSNA